MTTSPPPTGPPERVEAVLDRQVAALGDRPLLTFYDLGTGERSEFGYATFDNWARKTANLFEERGVGRGGRVLVAVDGHWSALVAVAACGLVGAAAAVAATLPEAVATGADLAVLHERYAAEAGLPACLLVGEGIGGRLTGADGEPFVAEALACDDRYRNPAVGAGDPWLLLPGEPAGSQAAALAADPAPDGRRLLLDGPLERLLPEAIGLLAQGRSMVVVRGGDAAARAHVAAQERCTGTVS